MIKDLSFIRNRIYTIIEVADGDRASAVYDITMIIVIVASIIPLAFKESNDVFYVIEIIASIVFIVDYILRLFTADLKLKRGVSSFFIYPFTPMAIIDLLCILPSFTAIAGGLRILKVWRLLRAFRVFRAFKAFRYSKSMAIIIGVIREQRAPLLAVCMLSFGYVLISALVIFNVEPNSFSGFFDAVYWATISLTTVGYGDIYPVSNAGRIVAMLSSILGIAVVALPAGIITGGYMSKLREKDKENSKGKDNVNGKDKN